MHLETFRLIFAPLSSLKFPNQKMSLVQKIIKLSYAIAVLNLENSTFQIVLIKKNPNSEVWRGFNVSRAKYFHLRSECNPKKFETLCSQIDPKEKKSGLKNNES